MRARISAAYILSAVVGIVPALGQRELPSATAFLADEIASGGKHRLAVVDFTDLQGCVTELGRFIAEEMALGFVTSKKPIAVIDRTHLRTILQENKLAASGIIDPATARKLGEIAGVDALVTGTITPLGDSVRLVAKVIDTKTAQILAASSIDMARTKAIEELLSRGLSSATACAVASDVAPGGRSGSQVPRSTALAGERKEAKQFAFELKSCKASGETVVCEFLVTNMDQDRGLYLRTVSPFSAPSRFFDSDGNVYQADSVRAGNQVNSQEVHISLVSGVPALGSLRFPKVPSGISRITLLEIAAFQNERVRDEYQYGGFTVQFRDVPITR